MAGNAKPDIQGLAEEADYTLIIGSSAQGQNGQGLFDGVTINEWNTSKVFYWSSASDYIEIDIHSNLVNIWRSGTTQWSGENGTLKIGKWNGSAYVDITSEIPQKLTSIVNGSWEKTISNLEKGRYRFSFNTAYRLDSEWYIESIVTHKILISSNSGGLRSIEKKDDMETAIPIMSSNTTPSGVASASSYNNDDQPWKAFDKGTVARSLWFTNQTPPTGGHWIQYEFSASKVVNKIAITTSVITTGFYGVRSFKFLGSNDGVNFELLFSGVQVDNPNRQEYVFENNKKYKTYRLNVVDSYQGTSSALINELEMFGFDMNFISFSEQAQINENLFLKYGANQQSLSNIDSIFEGVKSVSLNNVLLGDGKIFTHTIDLNKLDIKTIKL